MLSSHCCSCRIQTTSRSFLDVTGLQTSLFFEQGGVYNPPRSASLALRCAYPREWRERKIAPMRKRFLSRLFLVVVDGLSRASVGQLRWWRAWIYLALYAGVILGSLAAPLIYGSAFAFVPAAAIAVLVHHSHSTGRPHAAQRTARLCRVCPAHPLPSLASPLLTPLLMSA